jgi:hypothetical protein
MHLEWHRKKQKAILERFVTLEYQSRPILYHVLQHHWRRLSNLYFVMVYEVIMHMMWYQLRIQQLNMLLYVCSVWVARKPPGFAFIEFDDPRDADDAIRELDGKSRCLN